MYVQEGELIRFRFMIAATEIESRISHFQRLNKKIHPGESLRKYDDAKLHLWAPWRVNNDGSIYGIDVFEFEFETQNWHQKMSIEFDEDCEKYGFGFACVGRKLFVLGGERCSDVNGRLKFDTYDDVSMSFGNSTRTESVSRELSSNYFHRSNRTTSTLDKKNHCPVCPTVAVRISGRSLLGNTSMYSADRWTSRTSEVFQMNACGEKRMSAVVSIRFEFSIFTDSTPNSTSGKCYSRCQRSTRGRSNRMLC